MNMILQKKADSLPEQLSSYDGSLSAYTYNIKKCNNVKLNVKKSMILLIIMIVR